MELGSFLEYHRFSIYHSCIYEPFPIPALDGGHVMFTLYEMVSGRKPNEKFMEYAQVAGMILLLLLMLYANGNDWFGWGK